jgi:nitric oxide reductase subunit B
MMHGPDNLSPWWKRSVILILGVCFIVLIGISIKAYTDAPPIPEKVIDASGKTVFTADDILSGQEVFLKYGLMQNGSIWGHGAYLGPDFSAEYLHTLATHAAESIAQQQYQRGLPELQAGEKAIVHALVGQMLKENRYDARTGTLLFTSSETFSYQNQKENGRTTLLKHVKTEGC